MCDLQLYVALGGGRCCRLTVGGADGGIVQDKEGSLGCALDDG